MRFLSCAVALFLALPVLLEAQGDQTRDRRLREHEEKIRQIIDERRRAQEEEEARRAREAAESPDAPAPTGEREDRQRFVSNVVMGMKFLNEEGQSDYSTHVNQGDTFISEVYLFNEDQNPIDRVRLALDYDKRFLEPVRIFDSTLRPYTEEAPSFRLMEREAIMVYDAELAEPMTQRQVVLLRILWRAVRPAIHTGIDFTFDQDERDEMPHTAIYSRGQNILGTRGDPADGVLSGTLHIARLEAGEQQLQGKAEELRRMYLGSIGSTAKVGLHLIGPPEPPRMGEDFVVRVALDNPEGTLIDSLNFMVLFDPDVLQVVDSDRFNWINRGVNIHDGSYQRDFPWDIHQDNSVRNDAGLASYQKAVSNGMSFPSEVFADIRFRAIAPTTRTSVTFSPGRTGAPNLTSVRYFGYQLLDLNDRDISTPTVSFPVHPPTRERIAQLREEWEQSRRLVEPQQGQGIRDLAIERD